MNELTNVHKRTQTDTNGHTSMSPHLYASTPPCLHAPHHHLTIRFMLSPSGNAYDEPKTWEALVLGTIPILLRHPYAEAYTNLGLPVS